MVRQKRLLQMQTVIRRKRRSLSLYSVTLRPFFLPTVAVMILWLLFMGATKNTRPNRVWGDSVIQEWQVSTKIVAENGLIWEIDTRDHS